MLYFLKQSTDYIRVCVIDLLAHFEMIWEILKRSVNPWPKSRHLGPTIGLLVIHDLSLGNQAALLDSPFVCEVLDNLYLFISYISCKSTVA